MGNKPDAEPASETSPESNPPPPPPEPEITYDPPEAPAIQTRPTIKVRYSADLTGEIEVSNLTVDPSSLKFLGFEKKKEV